VQVDPTTCRQLPCQGYEDLVVEDVIFRTDNVLFHKRNFISPHSSDLSGVPAAGYAANVVLAQESGAVFSFGHR